MPLLRALLLVLLLTGCASVGESKTPPLACKTHDDGLAFWRKDDFVSAANCWRPLAEAGNARARMALGLALDRQSPDRWAFSDDPKRREAEDWLTLAAGQQLPNAEYELGQFLLRHWCQPKGERCALARDWLERAGWHEHRKAQEALSALYANPDLPVTDAIKAYYWNERVLDRSSDEPPRFLIQKQNLGNKLSADQKKHEDHAALHDTSRRYFRVYNQPISGTGAYWVIDSFWDRNALKNSFAVCGPLREMARSGNVMAAYGLGYLLSQRPPPEKREKNPCLEENAEAWLQTACDQGGADALQTLAHTRGHSCWITAPSLCKTIRPLLQQGAKRGSVRAIQSLISLPLLNRDYAIEKLYWMNVALIYYDRRICDTEKCYHFHGPNNINTYLTAEEKAQIAESAKQWKPDYP